MDKNIINAELKLIVGNASTVLATLPSKSVQCVITSPPYWGLRDYGINEQIGQEGTLPEFINNLNNVFIEVRRVLRDDGTLWLNVGDGYASGNRGYRAQDKKNPARQMNIRPDTPNGLKPKDLLGVPWRVAFALQESGWYLRSDIIWNKPNAMPESVKDRPSRSHEYVFLFSKNKKYYYNNKPNMDENGKINRSVWTINTKPIRDLHFATFPQKLVEPCIIASTRAGDIVLDPFCGSGTVGIVCKEYTRKFIGIDISSEYIQIASQRINSHNIKHLNIVTKLTSKDIMLVQQQHLFSGNK
jgi:site-specific DNA-methyltransferase (cytosine-N4-specific)